MQVSGSVGGGGEIKVNEAAATEAAKGFINEQQSTQDAMTMISQLESTLSDWKGSAADAAKKTFKEAEREGNDIGDGFNVIGELIINAQQTFSGADDAAAASMK